MLFDGENLLEKSSVGLITDKRKKFKKPKKNKFSEGRFFNRWYNFYFDKIKSNELNILEIGMGSHAGSLNMWKRYFINSKIYGIELCEKVVEDNKDRLNGIEIFVGDQADEKFLKKVYESVPNGFDIVIDDGSHLTNDQVVTFECLFKKLNSGGIYVIEDTHTSYCEKFKTKPHDSIINYLKEKVDDVNVNGRLGKYSTRENILNQTKKKLSFYETYMESIHFYPDICFIFKR